MVVSSSVFRFADVEVREHEYALVKAGEVTPVEPKAFRVLLILLRNPQKLIPKEELMNAVWGETAVTDNSLARSVALLRKVLGDDARQPRYIETVATVGYRFLCPVEVGQDSSAGVEAPAPVGSTAIKDGARGRAWPWWAAAGALLAAFAALAWYLSRPLPPPRVVGYTQLTHDGRKKFLGGTDGSRIYFTYTSPNTIGQVAVSGGEIAKVPVAVPATAMELNDVSPDGSSLLMSSVRPDTDDFNIWSDRVLGGSLKRLGKGAVGSFSPDGRFVVYGTSDGNIDVVGSDGAATRTLASPGKAGGWPVFGEGMNVPRWSPDGKRIRFGQSGKLWEMWADGTGIHPVLPDWQVPGYQAVGQWIPDGRFYFFLLRSDIEGGQIWAIDERRRPLLRSPGPPTQVTNGPIVWRVPIAGRDGSTIFAVGITRRGELSRFNMKAGRLEPFLGGISAEFVSFSKDGRYVAYVLYPEGTLWKANRDGSNAVQLTDPPTYPVNPRWSPDGTKIAFTDIRHIDDLQSFIVASDGGGLRRIAPNDNSGDGDPTWSTDGKKIVFSSRSKGAPAMEDLRILDVTSHQVSSVPGSAGLYSARWSPDGRTIAALARTAPFLRIFDISSQQWSTLQTTGMVMLPCFSSDSRTIYFVRWGLDQGIYRIGLKSGKEERVVDLKDTHLTGLIGLSFSLDPTDAPLVTRDVGSEDIYALKLETK